MKARQQGFTLVEIAIVMVIIGLLLGAVFKGQELVEQAKIKNTVKKIDEVRAAIYVYDDRYDALPGDD
ncbi:MAG TPA: type II secretion system protein, partial [Sulfurivirga caldicuralii]|nr:type II secretion system protein [Sulfurivirga caldicuralii]